MDKNHEEKLKSFLDFIKNKNTNLILKGGSALRFCYNSDRFTEDLDFDGKNKILIDLIKKYCLNEGFNYFIKKDTDTTQRCTIHYEGQKLPLKIEVSYRKSNIETKDIKIVNDIQVYDINSLFDQKILALNGRNTLRDLYDICFIFTSYKKYISESNINILRNLLAYKGIEYFDYLVENQKDDNPDLDINQMADNFLSMYDILNLIYNKEEYDIKEKYKNDIYKNKNLNKNSVSLETEPIINECPDPEPDPAEPRNNNRMK
ncbi:MAG: nucleotidyl transferase AbiEii/AbiGii toxin family protein [Deltaproteobacteria bacterium]|jgi:hypothetical protein|nr:nucleotidyl transferase AbiEii/AbiGii toxin family protein [Deltaproteobacteria bacterium]